MNISNRKLIALVALILVLSAAAGAAVYFRNPGGTQVLVTVNGEEYGTYPLHTDATVVISPADGSWHNTLVIADGKAYVSESDCDNQLASRYLFWSKPPGFAACGNSCSSPSMVTCSPMSGCS